VYEYEKSPGVVLPHADVQIANQYNSLVDAVNHSDQTVTEPLG
jgi:hypothetical protein